MSTKLITAGSLDKQSDCVSAQQKAVYNWYETHHSDDDVVDIYSLEWQDRITKWDKWFVDKYGEDHGHSETTKLRDAPQELDFQSFFFEYPIAAFSLWRVFEAFYEFDQAVLGTSDEAKETISHWRKIKPFKYLKSDEVHQRWAIELKKLEIEIIYGDLAGEELESGIYSILRAVERVETALDLIEDDFKSDYRETQSAEWMLNAIFDAFDERCLMIEKLPKKNSNQPPTYEVLISEPEMSATTHDGLAGVEPLPIVGDLGFFHPLFVFLDLIYLHFYNIIYIVLTLFITSIAIYINSHREVLGQGFGAPARYYE